ncbi:hypothetical protein C923_02655, partial [Plasmodium falciparum UGT5.1]
MKYKKNHFYKNYDDEKLLNRNFKKNSQAYRGYQKVPNYLKESNNLHMQDKSEPFVKEENKNMENEIVNMDKYENDFLKLKEDKMKDTNDLSFKREDNNNNNMDGENIDIKKNMSDKINDKINE